MKYEQVENGYVIAVGDSIVGEEITEKEFEEILGKIKSSPRDPNGYQYKLRADNLEWELVELPPVEPEPLTEEQALTRYANSLTGADDPDLISAAETLINKYSESKDKSEAYDILMGGAS